MLKKLDKALVRTLRQHETSIHDDERRTLSRDLALENWSCVLLRLIQEIDGFIQTQPFEACRDLAPKRSLELCLKLVSDQQSQDARIADFDRRRLLREPVVVSPRWNGHQKRHDGGQGHRPNPVRAQEPFHALSPFRSPGRLERDLEWTLKVKMQKLLLRVVDT